MSEKIKDRIRAILRKAGEGNPSEEEREVALRMAQRLMLKHGLTEDDIGDPNNDPGKFTSEPFFKTQTESEMWKGTLLCSIAEFYFCEGYAENPRYAADRNVANWFLLGKEEHIEIMKMMFEFIVPQLERKANEAQAAFGNIQERHARKYCVATCEEMQMPPEVIDGMSQDALAEMGRSRLELLSVAGNDVVEDIMELCEIESYNYAKKVRAYIKRKELGRALADSRLDVWRQSFFMGAIAEIRERLSLLMTEEVENVNDQGEGNAGTALVRNEREAIKRYKEDIGLETEARPSRRQIDRNGLSQGIAAGAETDLMVGKKLNMERKELNA